ncbi:MAG TPA: FAD-dependent monooxygenase [Chthoniobacterales bacterium]
MRKYDVIVVGAGPAGTTAAALTAQAGLRTLIIERSHFPRAKVCGDCVNPGCWEVFAELDVSAKVAALSHAALRWVDFVPMSGRRIRVHLPGSHRVEVGLPRQWLDAALLERATALGAEVWFGEPVQEVRPGWEVVTATGRAAGRFLVAADGRNSTVARLLREAPPVRPERVALQTHFEAVSTPHVALELHPEGYLGLASVGPATINLCLVARPRNAAALKAKASTRFRLAPGHAWRSVAPLSRAPIWSRHERLLYVGDAGHVVEPLTGEGIYYALKTGSIAAEAIHRVVRSGGSLTAWYASRTQRLYRNRLWVNQLARQAVLHPRVATRGLEMARYWPALLGFLTAKVVSR